MGLHVGACLLLGCFTLAHAFCSADMRPSAPPPSLRATGLHATMDGVQLALAVSTSLRKLEAALTAEEPPAAADEMETGYGEEEEVEEEVEEDDDEGDDEDDDGDDDEDGEEEEEGRADDDDDDDEEEDAPLSQRRARFRRAIPADDDEEEEPRFKALGVAGGVDVLSPVSASAGYGASGEFSRSSSAMPLKKRAAMAAAEKSVDVADKPGGGSGKPRWQPKLDDASLCSVAVAALCTLRRRGPHAAEGLLPVSLAALRRVPPMVTTTPLDALYDTLRVLVRTGFVVRRRDAANRFDSVGAGRPPTYALSPYGLEQLTIATSGQPGLGIGSLPSQPPMGFQRPPPGFQRPGVAAGAIGSGQHAAHGVLSHGQLPPAIAQQQHPAPAPAARTAPAPAARTAPAPAVGFGSALAARAAAGAPAARAAAGAPSPRSSEPAPPTVGGPGAATTPRAATGRDEPGTPPADGPTPVQPAARRLASVESSESLVGREDEVELKRKASEVSLGSNGKRKYRISKKKD